MNVIRGSVEVKGTSLGVGGLLIVLYNVDPGTTPEEALRGIDSPTAPGSHRLGSVLTDRTPGKQGQFEFQLEFPEEKLPRLLLVVLAPEEPGMPIQQRVLFTSMDIRQNAGTEEYLIWIPADALKHAGISVPIDPSVAREEPQAAVSKLRQAVEFRRIAESVRSKH